MPHRRVVGPVLKVIGGYAFDQKDSSGIVARSPAYQRIDDATYGRAWEMAQGAESAETVEEFERWR